MWFLRFLKIGFGSFTSCFKCFFDFVITQDLKCDFCYRAGPREGAYVHGIFMEGARWDVQQGIIMESKLKELYPQMPVINIRVIFGKLLSVC